MTQNGEQLWFVSILFSDHAFPEWKNLISEIKTALIDMICKEQKR